MALEELFQNESISRLWSKGFPESRFRLSWFKVFPAL